VQDSFLETELNLKLCISNRKNGSSPHRQLAYELTKESNRKEFIDGHYNF